jgi:hypothetical protein
VIPPNVTHVSCDLEQQERLHRARRESIARSVALRRGRRSLLDHLCHRAPREITAGDAFHGEGLDVAHSLRGSAISRS